MLIPAFGIEIGHAVYISGIRTTGTLSIDCVKSRDPGSQPFVTAVGGTTLKGVVGRYHQPPRLFLPSPEATPSSDN